MQTITEEIYNSLKINITDFILCDKAPYSEKFYKVYKKTYRIETKRINASVKGYRTDEEWKNILTGYNKPLAGKTTKSKKAIMYDFIGAIINEYIKIIMEELQNGNAVELGGNSKYMKMYFNTVASFPLIYNKKEILYRHMLKVLFFNPFKKKIKLNYLGRMNKMTYYHQIRTQLKRISCKDYLQHQG